MELAMENYKKKCLNIFIVLLIITSCNTQNSENKTTVNQIIPKKEMEQNKKETYNVFKDYIPAKKFNINEFNAKGKGKNDYRFIDNNGIEVHQFMDIDYSSEKIDGYWEYRKYPNSAYEFISNYNVKGLLLHTITTFHNTQFGLIKYYDASGNVTKEEDLDIPYKFSIDNLIYKMETEYNVDITDLRICQSASRGVYEEHNNIPLYDVWIKGDPTRAEFLCYVVDGITGETLFTTIRHSNDKQGSLTDNYFDSLKK